ncbi:MAG: hypothetical protein B6226_00350 [Candidatus Cloacimonetes bacterium 4572_65]|nr:MAG: hypothetical protein B6226_00350 [Candidatus Cloacimonetes bacterium 4572_65]
METLIKKLEEAGKVQQFEIYNEIFKKCFKARDKDIFNYVDDFINLLNEYLNFDAKPMNTVKEIISANFEVIFSFIRYSNDSSAFEKYFPTYKEHSTIISAPIPIINLYQHFGYIYWMRQNFDKSIEYLEKSLHLANENYPPEKLPNRYTNLGYIYESSGQLDAAETIYKQGLAFAKKHNSLSGIKLAYDAMGRLSLGRADYRRAAIYLEESLKLYTTVRDIDRASVISNLANAYIYLGNLEKAKKYFNEIQAEWVKHDDPEFYYSTLISSAHIYKTLKDYNKAEENLLNSLKYARSSNATEQLCTCLLALSALYRTTNKLVKAEECGLEALGIVKKNKNEKLLKTCFNSLAKISFEKKDYIKVFDYASNAINLAKKQNNLPNQMQLLKLCSISYEEIGDYKNAYDFITKYNKLNEKHLKEQKRKNEELDNNPLAGIAGNRHYVFSKSNSLLSHELTRKIGTTLIGKDPSMVKLINHAFMAAGHSNASILIRGESGTGKEIIAKLIHYSSSRSSFPFVAVNSAAFNPGVVNSALFGHEKGAFTGANVKKIGHIEAANRGTIFFDEIGEMPIETQISLLRVLEEKSIIPVGSNKAKKVNFRLISATNSDIYKHVESKTFRLDFLNRINTLEIVIPPLRDRKDDIPILVDYFIESICSDLNIPRPTLSLQALNLLCNYNYPGNVRELRNTIERLIIFNSSKNISGEDVNFLQNVMPTKEVSCMIEKTLNLEELEREAIIQAMKRANNVKVKAAGLLGISIYTLLRRLKKYE